ncbi:MAG: N-acetyltransferase family protein [Candidatus Limnocylindrales bacterium]|jgi:phosphinothricin acetyltransferase
MRAVTIERMRADHWPAVRAIYEEGIATGSATFERMAPEWEAWNHAHRPDCRLVARDGSGAIVGWAAVSRYSARAVYSGVAELSVYVAAGVRGRGVGRALLAALVAASEAAGIWTLQAGVMADNVASMALHESCGFRRVGVRERIGRDAAGRWRDVVLLERRSAVVGSR